MRRRIAALIAAGLLALAAPLLTACAAPPVGEGDLVEQGEPAEAGLMLSEGWAKAGEAGGMTGVFGTLANGAQDDEGGQDIVIIGVESRDASTVELHEVTAEGVMQEIEGEVVVPAGGSFDLSPGANHIMLMGLTRDLLAGDEVAFTVHYQAGDAERSAEFTVLVKDYAGANESYESRSDHAGH